MVFHNILKTSKNNKQLIGIRLYDNGDDFFLGFVEYFNELIIQLRKFNKDGIDDGIIILKINDIENFDFDSKYIKSYQKLIDEKYPEMAFKNSVSFKSGDFWYKEYLMEFLKKDTLIEFEINNEHVLSGFIIEIAENDFTSKMVEQEGIGNGYSTYRIDDITSLAFYSIDSTRRQQFYNYNQ